MLKTERMLRESNYGFRDHRKDCFCTLIAVVSVKEMDPEIMRFDHREAMEENG